jgi:superfamily I DNA/RNA helicase
MHDSVKLNTLHSSKGLRFSLVYMSATGGPVGEDQVLEGKARLLYMAMTRATP